MHSLWEVFSDWEEPEIVTRPARGKGFVQLLFEGDKYLVRHTETGSPVLMGRIATKFKEEKDHYHAAYIPSRHLPLETCKAIEFLLAPYCVSSSLASD